MRERRDTELRDLLAGLGSRRSGGRLDPEGAGRALAIGRELLDRTLGLRPFDEQLRGAAALLTGVAIEMDTGEGKTLVGALAAAIFAREGRRVHLLSVNDYLAERDAEWMRPFFDAAGVTVSWLGQSTPEEERRSAYRSDVVYAAVSEVGFDVLRDRRALSPEERVHPVLDIAIVDEADAVMVDEATVPLVLAGRSDDAADDAVAADAVASELLPGIHFEIDAEHSNVMLTEAGGDAVEEKLGGVNLYAAEQRSALARLHLALHARELLTRDVDYLVAEGEIKLINAARGRIAQLQRWPDGLHAAIEAKEGLAPTSAGVILDTITIQDLVGGYATRGGMSGTILDVADELLEFYELRSARIEPHRPRIRVDERERIFTTAEDARRALVTKLQSRHRLGQPVLVGTRSVSESESLGRELAETGIPARVLNARNDAEEAAIIALAGESAAVTISTQMSGRGTDIRLGGPSGTDRDRVLATGGLAVLALGRQPSRRLDAQLRGRSGRQGDPGTTIAFESLDSELVLANSTEHILDRVARSGASMSPATRTRIVDTAQTVATGIRRDQHRATWAYTRVIALQRAAVLRERDRVETRDAWREALLERRPEQLALLEREAGGDAVATAMRTIALHLADAEWCEHLGALQELRDGIHLRVLAGEDPATAFHLTALREFDGFLPRVHDELVGVVDRLAPADLERGLAELGLHRPGATWTYMMRDNPLGTAGDRAARGLRSAVRGRRSRTTPARTAGSPARRSEK